MRKEPLRVGFLGASAVARKAWLAIHRAGHCVTYIGCRDDAKGRELAARLQKEIDEEDSTRVEGAGAGTPQRFVAPSVGSYMDVVRAGNVDVVYISLPTAKRPAWVRVCAEYGKHVVSEKPAAGSAAELVECLEHLAANRLLFMDGTALSHSQRLQDVRRAVSQLGGPLHINAHMSFAASPTFMSSDIRLQPLLEPHGALGDLGWYCIRWILHLVDFALPTGVTGRVTECDALEVEKPGPAAITGFDGDMEFTIPAASSGSGTATTVTASFQCSFHECHDQTVEVFCRDGVVTVHGAINPTAEDRPRFTTRRCTTAAVPLTATRKESDAANAAEVHQVYGHVEDEACDVVYSTAPAETDGAHQMEQLWRDVGDSVMRLGKGEPLIADADRAKKWSTFAYVTQVVMDRALEAAGQHATATATP
ncbi:oxidoreductase-like protein [Novymonas esmeraldas]|uniref:Oxidoreductase-like protein n=1 Tax=Novymonas esmeraldas TaxID=1808958 RepID=A0AAW0ERK1_9TRYP